MDEQSLKSAIRRIVVSGIVGNETETSKISDAIGISEENLKSLFGESDDVGYIFDRLSNFGSESLHRDQEQMIEIVDRIIKGEGTKGEIDEWFRILGENVPMPIPEIVNLIFYPDDGLTPAANDVVEKALSYKTEVTLL